MLTTRIIPCLDTRDGRVVKGINFRGLRDAGSPVELAARYEAAGADEMVLLDIVATDRGRKHALETVRAVRGELRIPLTVGGGVRNELDAEQLLEAGADKIAVNSSACADPSLLDRLCHRFGAQCVVLAIDAAATGGGWTAFSRSGSEPTALEPVTWAHQAASRGAGEILLTSIDRDGTRSGYDLDLLRAVRAVITIPMIASGGARTTDDLIAAVNAGADAVLAASIFHDGDLTVAAAKQAMRLAGLEVRQ